MDVENPHSHNDEDNDIHLAKLCEIYFPSSHHHQKETYQAPVEHPAAQRRQLEDLYKMKAKQQQQQLILQQMYWQQMQQVNQIVQNPHQIMNSQPSTNTQRNKLEKRLEKKQTTYLVEAANLQAADGWAWRKYGQKPIKGCNYPRSYYKCSSSKGCKAKKQIEKIQDPDVYMVTYKGEHSHLNPVQPILFAGSVLVSMFGDNNRLSDMTQPPLQPPPEVAPDVEMKVVEEDEKEEELLIPNLMMVDQDMLTSMEELKNYYKRINYSGHDGSGSSGGSGFN